MTNPLTILNNKIKRSIAKYIYPEIRILEGINFAKSYTSNKASPGLEEFKRDLNKIFYGV